MNRLKRKIGAWILVMAMVLAPMIHVQHASANGSIGISGVPESVKIDETFTITVSIPTGYMAGLVLEYNADVISFESASFADYTGGRGDLQFSIYGVNTATITFKALTEGESDIKVYVNDNMGATDAEANDVELTPATAKVIVKNEVVEETPDDGGDNGNENEGGNQTPEQPVKSADNSLQYIKLSHGTLSPEFKYNVVNYTVTVDHSVTSIVVDAKTSNAKAKIESVTGYDNLQVGENTITIVVVAENGVKATYRIVVTRLANTGDAGTGDNSGDEGGNGDEGNNGSENGGEESGELKFDYNGLELFVENDIPQDMIPKHFKENIIEVDGKKIAALTFEKGELTVLCLKNAEGYRGLYVYSGSGDDVYPLIKITAENSYVIILQPKEEVTVDGFKRCTLSLEGKGTVVAFQKEINSKNENNDQNGKTFSKTSENDITEANVEDFYLIYCINSRGECGWYLYDAVEMTFQRYVSMGTGSGDMGNIELNEQEIADMAAQNMQLMNRQDRMEMILYALAAAVGILLLALIIITIMGMRSSRADESEVEEELQEEVRNTPYGMLKSEEITERSYEEPSEGEEKNSPYGKLIPEDEGNAEITLEEKADETAEDTQDVSADDFDVEVSVNDAFPEDEGDFEDEDLVIFDV